MRKIILVVCCLILIVPIKSFAGKSELFNYNRAEVETIFTDLDELESYINLNEDVTLSSLYSANSDLAYTGPGMYVPPFMIEPPLGIPSIIWGVVFGPVGVVLVYYLTDEDKEEAKKALYGCIAGGVLWGAVAIIPSVIGAGSSGCMSGFSR